MKYLVIDDNEKVHHLLKGRYENGDVLFYNANEAELRPDYDYRTLLAKSYTEITGNVHSHIFKNPKHKTISWPLWWLLDTIGKCWHPENPTDPDRYWQTTKFPEQLYTCMLGQDRPHRVMIHDLLNRYDVYSPYHTFVARGIYKDISQPRCDEVARVRWTPENQVLTHQFPPWYDDVIIDLVVETHEDMTFYTEKTWKPFLGMRVPFIFGNVYMNEQLGEWGFWIDDCDIFDLSFYQEPHPYLRAKMLVKELQRIQREIPLKVIHEKTLEMRKHNQRQCFNILDDIRMYEGVPVNPDDVNMLQKARDIKSTLDF